MATTKATAKKPIKEATTVKSLDELRAELAAKRQDLLTSQRSHRAGELVNPRVLGTIRKEIARLMTAMKVHETSAKEESK